MRNTLLLGAAAALALAVSPATADVFVTATIDKKKDKRVEETIAKVKKIDLRVTVAANPDKFAESEAIVNQKNHDNHTCENCAEKKDEVVNSVNDNTGFTSLNQAGGNMNNQANALSVAVDAEIPGDGNGTNGGTGFAESQAAAEQKNRDNDIHSVAILFRDGLIEESVNGNTGVTWVNQSTGQMNNQANLLSIAVALAPGVALSEADLGQLNADNKVVESGVFKTAVMTNSVNGNTGTTAVNQSSGNMANQANVTAIGAAGAVQF